MWMHILGLFSCQWSYKSSHFGLLFHCGQIISVEIVPFTRDVTWLHGCCKISSLGGMLEPESKTFRRELLDVWTFCGNGCSSTNKSLLVDTWWWTNSSWLMFRPELLKFCKACPKMRRERFCAVQIFFDKIFVLKTRLSTSSPRKAWMAWIPRRLRDHTAPSSNPWPHPWSASHRG